MKQYFLGDRVRLATSYDPAGRPIPSVYRAEVTRPDGSTVRRDWDKHDMRLRVNQIGIWSWTLYIRENDVTRAQHGQFEVVPAGWPGIPARNWWHRVRKLFYRE